MFLAYLQNLHLYTVFISIISILRASSLRGLLLEDAHARPCDPGFRVADGSGVVPVTHGGIVPPGDCSLIGDIGDMLKPGLQVVAYIVKSLYTHNEA